MKKLTILALLLTFMFSLVANDREMRSGNRSEEIPRVTAAERAERIMERYTEELVLTTKQAATIRVIVVDRTTFMQENRPDRDSSDLEQKATLKRLKKILKRYDERICNQLDKKQIKLFKKMQKNQAKMMRKERGSKY
ncbi:MAG: hypothetical protein P9L91_05425 [Candidatus Zophobacter franzmannii]|jgi:hypothetical protein|nr:hypothetical protein [Candidatus Zophobacter franzmannii]